MVATQTSDVTGGSPVTVDTEREFPAEHRFGSDLTRIHDSGGYASPSQAYRALLCGAPAPAFGDNTPGPAGWPRVWDMGN